MARLSVVMIVYNESAGLRSCIESVRWADEIVIVDGGSHDGTVGIAREFTEHVYVEPDWQGFGVQRQRAQARASGDWILVVDADEHVTPELGEEIRRAVDRDDRTRIYAMPRLSFCFGRAIRHGGWYPGYVRRLYPRDRAAYDDTPVHENLRYDGGMVVERLRGDLLHYTGRDLEHRLVKSTAYASAWAAEQERLGRRAGLLQAALHGAGAFLRMYVVRAGFLDGRAGLLLAILSGRYTFAKYAGLRARCRIGPA